MGLIFEYFESSILSRWIGVYYRHSSDRESDACRRVIKDCTEHSPCSAVRFAALTGPIRVLRDGGSGGTAVARHPQCRVCAVAAFRSVVSSGNDPEQRTGEAALRSSSRSAPSPLYRPRVSIGRHGAQRPVVKSVIRRTGCRVEGNGRCRRSPCRELTTSILQTAPEPRTRHVVLGERHGRRHATKAGTRMPGPSFTTSPRSLIPHHSSFMAGSSA